MKPSNPMLRIVTIGVGVLSVIVLAPLFFTMFAATGGGDRDSYFTVLVVALLVVAGVFSFLRNRKRLNAIRQWAREHGYVFSEHRHELTQRWTTVPFGMGSKERVLYAVEGVRDGVTFTVFEYCHSIKRGDSETTRTFHLVAAELGRTFPELQVHKEDLVMRLFDKLSSSDVELESEDFNRAFSVTAEDARTAVAMLSPQVMARMLDSGVEFDSTVWEDGAVLVCGSDGWEVERIDAAIAYAVDLVKLYPSHLQ